jgi:hypothetical protein
MRGEPIDRGPVPSLSAGRIWFLRARNYLRKQKPLQLEAKWVQGLPGSYRSAGPSRWGIQLSAKCDSGSGSTTDPQVTLARGRSLR